MDKNHLEQTLVLIKPDALKNSVTGFILAQLSEFHTGSRFAATKIVNVNRMLAEEHYAEHKGKVFYESLLDYITGRAHYSNEDKWKRRVIAILYLFIKLVKRQDIKALRMSYGTPICLGAFTVLAIQYGLMIRFFTIV